MIIRVAARNAVRNKRRSAYTVLAVAFGLMCLIVFQALKVGLHSEMVRSTVELDTGSVQVHATGYEPNLASLKPLGDHERAVEALKSAGALAVAERVRVPALLLARDKSSTVVLTGIDPAAEPRITFIKEKMTKGAYPDAAGSILLAEGLAETIGLGVGDELSLMAQDGSGKAVARKFKVGGLYRTALAGFDRTHVYLEAEALRDFIRTPGVVTELVAKGEEGGEEELAARVRPLLDPAKFQVRTWKEIAPDVDQLTRLNDSTMTLLIAIVFAIVAMGIVNTMSMAVFERFHEIGVMLAMGAKPSTIFALIVAESAALGVLSALVGSALGLIACAYLSRYGVDLTSLTSANHYFATSHVLKAKLLWSDLVWANLLTIATATLAGVFPAQKAVRLEAVEALGHV